jgi:hypothetical protein
VDTRTRTLRHSIGPVQLMKFVLAADATDAEVSQVFQNLASQCLNHGLRGALVVVEERPDVSQAQLKTAVRILDLNACPRNFRLAVVAFRKPAYDAFRYALGALGNPELHRLFWDEVEAMEWLHSQFPE